jgi:hypothetical protein
VVFVSLAQAASVRLRPATAAKSLERDIDQGEQGRGTAVF